MKKPLFLLAAFLCASALAAPAAPPAPSLLVQAGTLMRMNKLCDMPVVGADARALGDVLLASSVNPDLTGFEGSDKALVKAIQWPTQELQDRVARNLTAYTETVAALSTKHETVGSVCTPDLAKDVTSFLGHLRADGRAANASRLVALMMANNCATLGCGALLMDTPGVGTIRIW